MLGKFCLHFSRVFSNVPEYVNANPSARGKWKLPQANMAETNCKETDDTSLSYQRISVLQNSPALRVKCFVQETGAHEWEVI